MKIQAVSDLHTEFGAIPEKMDKLYGTDADLTVIAGDFSTFGRVCKDLEIFCNYIKRPVVFVPGNHEYYGGKRSDLDQQLKSLNIKDLHVLIEGKVEIDGVMFLGSTGWWDGSGGTLGLTVKHALNDFFMIHDLKENLDGVKWGRESKMFFQTELYRLRNGWQKASKYEGKIVCVSHHYPHPNSIAKPFRGSPLNVCFGNRWEGIIRQFQPDVWIHGHTHFGFNYREGNTRIVCNPQGYPIKEAPSMVQLQEEADRRGIEVDDASARIFMSTENMNYVPDLVIEV